MTLTISVWRPIDVRFAPPGFCIENRERILIGVRHEDLAGCDYHARGAAASIHAAAE